MWKLNIHPQTEIHPQEENTLREEIVSETCSEDQLKTKQLPQKVRVLAEKTPTKLWLQTQRPQTLHLHHEASVQKLVCGGLLYGQSQSFPHLFEMQDILGKARWTVPTRFCGTHCRPLG